MISSTKSMTGHMLGATGAFEAMVCAKALEEGIIPPPWGIRNPTPTATWITPPTRRKKPIWIMRFPPTWALAATTPAWS